jgi:AcrR family transcriptional regulator
LTDLPVRILSAAWEQIAQAGAAALSLRAVARQLGITAPAIYNYYPDRDALVTALIVDAFHSFGDALQAAVDGLPAVQHARRLYALGMAYRQWAITYPERYQLIFGTPIAGYVAPQEITMPAAARALAILSETLANAHAAGLLKPMPTGSISPDLQAMFQVWAQARGEAPSEVLYLTLVIWAQVHGLAVLEIGGQFPPFISDPGALYERTLEMLVNQVLEVEA